MQAPPCLHEQGEACQPISFNTWETQSTEVYPAPDVMNYVKRGFIQRAENLGLRTPQGVMGHYDGFNSGCLDVHGCANNLQPNGYICPGKGLVSMGKEMKAAYSVLNSPFDSSGSEWNPPSYMMGIKDSGPNSVYGFAPAENGMKVYQVMAEKALAETGVKAALPPQKCGQNAF